MESARAAVAARALLSPARQCRAVCTPPCLGVQGVLQGLAGLEFRALGCRDLNLLAGTRVAPLGGCPLTYRESAKSHEANLVALLQRPRDGVERRFHCLAGFALGKPGTIRNLGNQFVLVHLEFLSSMVSKQCDSRDRLHAHGKNGGNASILTLAQMTKRLQQLICRLRAG